MIKQRYLFKAIMKTKLAPFVSDQGSVQRKTGGKHD